ncbi:Lysophospholipase L1 [Cyclobacterium lianum]|uniref:Lysophospholipase L1 n=1 Tax=Cyclobacterium lianum TaxID=388280 RepID=A0A1M7KHM2_9BACT|nr:GDSL-type esterase/lipase family protein [Cyclobacterium lianum]SHM64808.1 Lysophospholipase L1 [Cyclobacterium lianum]
MRKVIYALLFFLGHGAFAQQPVKVACVGNSITEGPGRKHRDSYPMQLQRKLGDAYLVKNLGVGARTLMKKGDFPFWREPQFKQAMVFKPDILIIKLGTNDSKPQNWIHKENFITDYVEMVEILKNNMPENGKIYLCLPAPVFEDNYGITEKVIVNEMTPMIRDVAKKTESEIIDLHEALKPYGELFPDGVHPNREGAGVLADAIKRHIQR